MTMVLLILIAGLRYRLGADTPMYIDYFYNTVPTLDKLSLKDISIKYLLWDFINSIVRTIGGHFYIVQLIQSTLVNFLLFKYVKKHGLYLFTFIMFYYLWFFTSFNMEVMKASISMIICLYGNDYILSKKWLKGYSLYFIACLFHYSTLIILLTPLLFFLRFDKKGVIAILTSFIFGYILQKTMGDYLNIFEFSEEISAKAEDYSSNERFAESKGLRFFIFNVLPIVFYGIVTLIYLKNRKFQKSHTSLLRLEPFIMIGIVLEMIRANIDIFYRYTMFYYVYIALLSSHVFVCYAKKRLKKSPIFSYLLASFVFAPLIICYLHQYPRKYFRYYPYYTVLDRKIDRKRELKLYENRPWRDVARFDRY